MTGWLSISPFKDTKKSLANVSQALFTKNSYFACLKSFLDVSAKSRLRLWGGDTRPISALYRKLLRLLTVHNR